MSSEPSEPTAQVLSWKEQAVSVDGHWVNNDFRGERDWATYAYEPGVGLEIEGADGKTYTLAPDDFVRLGHSQGYAHVTVEQLLGDEERFVSQDELTDLIREQFALVEYKVDKITRFFAGITGGEQGSDALEHRANNYINQAGWKNPHYAVEDIINAAIAWQINDDELAETVREWLEAEGFFDTQRAVELAKTEAVEFDPDAGAGVYWWRYLRVNREEVDALVDRYRALIKA